MKRILVFSLSVIFVASSLAQITFEKRYDYDFAEAGHDIQQTSDGGYILAGRQGIWIGFSKILLIKTDSLGNEEWHQLLGENNEQYADAVLETEDGGFMLSGHTVTDSASFDMYLIKTNSQGEIEWTKTFGGVELDFSNDIISTEDGGYILAGGTRSYSNDANQDVYIVKVDGEGNLEWEKVYGGEDFDIGYSIKNVSTGGFIIAGQSRRPGLGAQAYLIRTDAQGDSLWTKTYGWEKSEFGQDVVETPDGGFLLAGRTVNSSSISFDKYLVRTDSEGDTIWTRIIPDNDTKGESIYSVLNTPDGNFVTVGRDSRDTNPVTGTSQVEIIKYDTEGNILWRNEYGGEARIRVMPAL